MAAIRLVKVFYARNSGIRSIFLNIQEGRTMAETPLTKKLGIKPGQKMLILNAPDHYMGLLEPLPENIDVSTKPAGTYDFVQLFVRSIADLNDNAMTAINAVKPNGLLWIVYPKKSGKIKTDITRDVGWETVIKAGWDGVTLISVDDTWSSLRFRPLADIKSRDGVARMDRKKQDKK
jgi:hypothetical protein